MKTLIVISIFILIIIFTFVYLYYYACKKGHFFSLDKFSCTKCTECAINKWYDPKESCKNFSDSKCKNHTICSAAQKILKFGTQTTDTECSKISDCYVECGDNNYAFGKYKCNTLRGGKMSCKECLECSEDEIDIKNLNCTGREISYITSFKDKSRVILNPDTKIAEWKIMSCKGLFDRVCIPKKYIKFSAIDKLNINFTTETNQNVIIYNIDDKNNNVHNYYSIELPTFIKEIVNKNNSKWNTTTIGSENAYDMTLSYWKIKPIEPTNILNCPIEEKDIFSIYSPYTVSENYLLTVVDDDGKFFIGSISNKVGSYMLSSSFSGTNVKFYTKFSIDNIEFKDKLITNITDISGNGFQIQVLDAFNQPTGLYLTLKKISSNNKYFLTVSKKENINTIINFIIN